MFEAARREWRWVEKNPCRDVRRPPATHHRERIITQEEIKKICKVLRYQLDKKPISIGQQIAVAFLLALETGMRAGEINALQWSDVESDYVRLHTSKTGGGRNVPLTTQASLLLDQMRGINEDEIFAFTPSTRDAYFRKAKKEAELEGLTFHDSRHTAATRLAGSIHVLDLCKMFGWSKPKRAMTYYNPTASDIAKRLRRKG